MEFRKAVVLHCDILGFSEVLKSKGSDRSFLSDFKRILDESLAHLVVFKEAAKGMITYKVFSDNLYISYSFDEDDRTDFSVAFLLTIYLARIYQVLMLKSKYLIRGGISVGDDYSDDKIIFSLPLLEAYELESKKAVYPRIMIHENLLAKIKDGLEVPLDLSDLLHLSRNAIVSDYRNDCFVNPEFNHFKEPQRAQRGMENIIKKVDEMLSEEKEKKSKSDIRVFEKILWLKSLLEWVTNGSIENNHGFYFVLENNQTR